MAVGREYQLESIYQALGPSGKFTKLQLFLMWFSFVPTALQLLSNVFIGLQVPHRCAAPANETDLVKPYQHYKNVTVVYKQCEILIKSDASVLKAESCIYGMEFDEPVESSFISEFDLVCDATNLGRLTQSLVIIGQAFGAVVGAIISDRLGRKTVLIASNFGLLVTGLIIAYAPNFAVFAAFKFIVGAFQQALVGVNQTIMLELMVVKDRRIAAALAGLFWGSGVILLDVIAFALKGNTWRTVQMVLSLASLPLIIQWWFMKESLRWMLANGKTKQATEYIKCAAKMNGKNAQDILGTLDLGDNHEDKKAETTSDEESSEDGQVSEDLTKATKKLSYIDIFRIPRLLLNTLVMWIAWFTTAFGFFAIYLTATSLAGDRYLNFFFTATMEIPSNVFFYFGLNRFGRKFVLICVFMTMSLGLIACGIFRSLEPTTVNSAFAIVFSMMAMAGASGCFSLVFAYTPELFPTNIRNQALGINSLISRIGGMLAPFTGILSEHAKWGPGLLIGCLASLVAMLLRFLPETNGRELPQTLEELQKWFKKDKENDKNGVRNDAIAESNVLL